MKQHEIKTVLILDYLQLPKLLQDRVAGWCGFHNDCLLPCRSEFSPNGEETWETSLTSKQVADYHRDQANNKYNPFTGSLADFITEYRLEFEVWLIEQIESGNINVRNIEAIYINISW